MPIAAAITGAATLGGGLLSSIFGKKSNDRTNETNLKIAQMNNEWSEKMMDKQNIYNIDQWNREAAFAEKQAADANAFTEYMQDKANKYNSAQEQAKRLREAGLNPSIVMNGGNAGTAQGASGVQAATPSGNSVGLPSPSSAQMRPYDYSGISRSITDAAMVALQVMKQQAELTNMNLNNEYLYKSMQSRLAQDFEKGRAQKYDTDFRQMNESVRVARENEQYLGEVTSRLMAKEQMTLVKEQQARLRIENTFLPDAMKADISLKLATAEYQGTSDLAKDLKFFEKKYGRKLTKDELKTIFDAWKQNIIYAPTRGMSMSGIAATIGNLVGNYFKR